MEERDRIRDGKRYSAELSGCARRLMPLIHYLGYSHVEGE